MKLGFIHGAPHGACSPDRRLILSVLSIELLPLGLLDILHVSVALLWPCCGLVVYAGATYRHVRRLPLGNELCHHLQHHHLSTRSTIAQAHVYTALPNMLSNRHPLLTCGFLDFIVLFQLLLPLELPLPLEPARPGTSGGGSSSGLLGS